MTIVSFFFFFFFPGMFDCASSQKEMGERSVSPVSKEADFSLVKDKDGEFFSPRDSSNCYRSLEVKILEDCMN